MYGYLINAAVIFTTCLNQIQTKFTHCDELIPLVGFCNAQGSPQVKALHPGIAWQCLGCF